MNVSSLRLSAVAAVLAAGAALCTPAAAVPIDWASWSNVASGGVAGSATLTFGSAGLTATYSGELESLQRPYPSFTPTPTFSGGTVGNAPPSANGIIQIFGGGNTRTDTVTFSQAVVNPVLAIWSLGQPGLVAQFDFLQPFAIESGGANAEYGGAAITSAGNAVFGAEGNGTIQFLGTFSSISWTTPVFENWYGFTVGTSALAVPGVPEPETYALMLAGLGVTAFMARRRRAD